MSTAASRALASEQNSNVSSPPPNPSPAIDRNSAIASSIILFLILVAIAWYLRIHLAQKRQTDLERQVQAERGGGGEHFDTPLGRVPWDRACSSCGNPCEERGGGGRAGSFSKLKEVVVRKYSIDTSSSSPTGTPTTPTESCHQACNESEKNKWPGLSHWRTHHPRTSTSGQDALIFQQHTLPLTSTERPLLTPSSPRRHSRQDSFDPPPLRLYNTVYPVQARRRSSSLSNGTYDRRWWNEVARRGSTTSPTRQSLDLEAGSEPEDLRSHAGGARGVGSEVSVGCRDQGRGSTGSVHASWKGSRCESIIYDWTRPKDDKVQAKGEMNFTGVIWDGQQHRGAGSKEEENIESMDWELKM